MTVSSTLRKAGPFEGNDVATAFDFEFKVFSKADVQVIRTLAATGADTTLVLDSDYSVTLNADQDTDPGGVITYPLSGSPLADTHTLTILSDIETTQATKLLNLGGWKPRVVEDMIDRVTALIQQYGEIIGRTLRFSASSDVTTAELPASRANTVFGFDSAGNITYYPTTVTVYGMLRDFQTAAAGQTVFNLGFSYALGVNGIAVYANGLRLRGGIDYTETSTTSVTLTTPAQLGDEFEFVAGQEIGSGTGDAATTSYIRTGLAASNVADMLDTLTVSVDDPAFGAAGDDITNDAAAIQAALDYVRAQGGGTVELGSKSYYVGTASPAINLWSNTKLVGRGMRSSILRHGGGHNVTVVKADSVKHCEAHGFEVQIGAHTGSDNFAVHFNGSWHGAIKDITSLSILPANGYGVLLSAGTAWGAYHNVIENIYAVTGQVGLVGNGGSDAVTTTNVRCCWLQQYYAIHAFAHMDNVTVEGFANAGFTLEGAGAHRFTHCDIEGAGAIGLSVTAPHKAYVGPGDLVFDGFTGGQKFSGALSDLIMWADAGIDFRASTAAGALFGSDIAWRDDNAYYAYIRARANATGGGVQDGHLEIYRKSAGTDYKQLEFRNTWRVEHSKLIAAAGGSGTKFMTLPITNGGGGEIKVIARGFQSGAGYFTSKRIAVVDNNLGAMVVTTEPAVNAAGGGSTPVITFVASGSNIEIFFNHGSATPTTISFIVIIEGDVTSYTLN